MKPEYGWLIEHNEYAGGHRWLRAVRDEDGDRVTIRLEFTPHAVAALRFARKEDADAFIYLHPTKTVNCRATDHQFGV